MTNVFSICDKKSCNFRVEKFNSKLETSLANTLLASVMSDHGDEDREDTANRLDEEFPGSTEVRGTTRERIKTGITGAAAAQGFKTRGLTGTGWSQAVSVTLQVSVFVSMASGGVGNGSILQLLAPVSMGDAANSPSQTSSSDAVRLPDRTVSDSAVRQRASRQNWQESKGGGEKDGAWRAETEDACPACPENIAAQKTTLFVYYESMKRKLI